MAAPFLSVVSPCYNEQESLLEFHHRVSTVCQRLRVPYEIVVVNDGSQDHTWGLMRQLAEDDPHVVCVNLMRNHGHQLALRAGLHVCRGERILILDADLQDPPELLPQMLALMDEGADVVYGQRRRRQGETVFKRTACALFYRTIARLSDTPIPLDTGDFRLITRKVLDLLLAMPERHCFLRGLISWIGGRQVPLLYDRDPRFAGETKYPLAKLMRLAWDGITSFSIRPLQMATRLGLGITMLGVLLLVCSLIGWLRGESGGTFLLAGMSLLAGIQLLALGVIGEYLGRLYDQSKGRPLFLISEILNHEVLGTAEDVAVLDRPRVASFSGGAQTPVVLRTTAKQGTSVS